MSKSDQHRISYSTIAIYYLLALWCSESNGALLCVNIRTLKGGKLDAPVGGGQGQGDDGKSYNHDDDGQGVDGGKSDDDGHVVDDHYCKYSPSQGRKA